MADRRAQSTLEYVIILTAIIATVVAFATLVLRPKVQSSLEHVTNEMDTQVQKIDFSGTD